MATLWQVSIDVPAALRLMVEAAFGDDALSVSAFTTTPDDRTWRIAAIFENKPDRKTLATALHAILPAEGPGGLEVVRLPANDWITASLSTLPPITVGRFHLHGGHHPRRAPPCFDLLIDAGEAFGTGNHETTRGCLRALATIARRQRCTRVLDLGTGTGVLALAAARLWRKPVLALDIDPVAVRVARENAHRNALRPWLRACRADGLKTRVARRREPFDLIFGNLFARPLVRFAAAIARHLEPGGYAVLSGLLRNQAAAVISAYRQAGMQLVRCDLEGEWATLTLRRPTQAVPERRARQR